MPVHEDSVSPLPQAKPTPSPEAKTCSCRQHLVQLTHDGAEVFAEYLGHLRESALIRERRQIEIVQVDL